MRLAMMAVMAISTAGCGSPTPSQNSAAEVANPSANPASARSAATAPAAANEAAITLRGDGLGSGLGFGIDGAAIKAALAKATGKTGVSSQLEDCGPSPLTQVRFGAITVTIIDGRFKGWFESKGVPVLKASDGLAVGSPRAALGATQVEASTIGLEFVRRDGIAGLVDERGRSIEALWAGEVCIFR